MKAKCGIRNITVTVRKQIQPLTSRKQVKITCAKITTNKTSSKPNIQQAMKIPCMNLENRRKPYFIKENTMNIALKDEDNIEMVKCFKKGWLEKCGGKVFLLF